MADLQVGVKLLDYANRLTEIEAKLLEASLEAHSAADLLAGDDGFYDGQAHPEMKQFVDSYAANIDKLMMFDSAASEYLGKVFDTFDAADKALIVQVWLEAQP